ncbi:ankyrin repeat domain-containing protein 7-like [Mytilus trossulus]|uniref:ankyrin repeat domain-containing protein 7-like n=1 Tax=Mytilus trossulus TaxID=6551 RepID=UPI00300649F5
MELISLVKSKKDSKAINLIENGIDTSFVDQDDNTALHYASSAGLVNVIISILEESVLTLDSCGKDGHTAVHFAVINKNIEALVALVTYGANINMLDEPEKT